MKNIIKNLVAKLILDSENLFQITKKVNPYIKKLKIKGLYEYCVENSKDIIMIDDRIKRKYRKPPTSRENYEIWNYSDQIERECSRQYIVCLKDAIVSGQMDGVCIDGFYLSDKVDYDKNGFLNHLPHGMKGNNTDYIIWKTKSEEIVIERAISLIKMWSMNYFHCVFEGLSRLGEVDRFSEYDEWPILIDQVVRDDPRNLELIECINTKKRPIVWVSEKKYYRVLELVVPPCMAWGIWDIRISLSNAWGYMIDKKAGEFLRATVLEKHVANKKYNCVYVARGNNQRLINESEIIDYFYNSGFDVFYPDKSSFSDEVDCFSTANCIVLCAGGASTNLIFCKDSVEVFCILPYMFRCDSPEDVTSIINIDTHMCDAEIVDQGDILMHSKIKFSTIKCKEIVDFCIEKGYLETM